MISSSALNDQFISRSVTPVLVWATKNPDEETREQVIANHERFRKLPFESKYKLGFQHTPAVIQKIGEDFSLDPLKMASIARAVRNFYFGDLPREKIAEFLVEEMEISMEQAQKIASLVVQKIIDAPIPKEVSDQTAELPLLDAMAKYQRLSEQNITEDRIMVKGESQPVRGSLRNWVRHYRDNMGIRKHTAIERGQFLFQGENTRRLGAPEREKLSLVFRSLEENEPISIDTERQEILFPAFEERSVPSVPKPETSPEMGTSFRPVEKFPASQAPIKKALEWNADQNERGHLFGNVPVTPRPNVEAEKPRAVGVSAPVYSFPTEAPGTPPASSSPAKMSFSSSHVLPHEKETLSNESPKKNADSPSSNDPLVMSVIRPRGDRFGFRGTPPPPGGQEE